MSAVPGVGGMIGQIPLPAKLDRAGMAGGRRHGFQDHPPPRPRPQWRGGGAIGLAGVIDRGRTDTVRTGIVAGVEHVIRSEEHTSELQSLMRISYAVFCLKQKKSKHMTK